MGIQGLTKLLTDNTKTAVREVKYDSYFGRKVAIDASMHIYQFMAVVGRSGDTQLTSEAGDITSHLQGMFNRTVRMLDAGIRPVYVFDGKPPTLKSGELAKRKEKREEATEALAEAKETGTAEEVEKFGKRTLRVTKEHNEECKRLLRLMGVPVVEAPCEAEATCAELCKHNKVYAAASEDMDTLTFNTPKLARNLMAPASADKPVLEIDTAKVLEELGITREQFVDVCILCGCDYCDSIRGIGPTKALQFIKEHGNIEGVIEHIRKLEGKGKEGKGKGSAFVIPDPFPFDEARRLFLEAEVTDVAALEEFKWNAPDEEGLIQFLVREKTFNEERVKSAITKIKAAKGKAQQGRMESFFGASTIVHSAKRAEPDSKGKGKGKGKEAAGPAAKKSKGVGGGKKK